MLHLETVLQMNLPFDIGMQKSKLGMSLTNKNQGRSETFVDNEVLRATVEKDPCSTVGDYAEELGVSPLTISCHLKLIGKVKIMDKWVPRELNENHKHKCFEISSTLLLCSIFSMITLDMFQ